MLTYFIGKRRDFQGSQILTRTDKINRDSTSSNLAHSDGTESARKQTQKLAKDPLDIFFEKSNTLEYRATLSTDHLILLVQYNVYRGCLHNLQMVGVTRESSQKLILTSPKPNSPPTFYPTLLQQTVKHAAWIDSLPHPTLRDNFIREAGKYDSAQYWWDLVGDLHASYDETDLSSFKTRKFESETNGLICWADPWTVTGFEISPKHYKKWYKLHKGCEGLLHASNQWRERRGESPVRWEEIIETKE